jgi:hypothetical protein
MDVDDSRPSGNPRATAGQGLRIFRLLKARKVVFTDPNARIPTGYAAPTEPLPVDLGQLRAALNCPEPARAAVVALVTFCGLRNGHLRSLLLTDLRDGRLHIGGAGRPGGAGAFGPPGAPAGAFGSRGAGDGRVVVLAEAVLRDFTTPRAQILNQSPELVDC